jgi:hypothetical protein
VTGNLIQGNANYFIGSSAGGSEFFNGYYASFKMYNKGLSATEVQQNYQATKDKFLGQNIVTQGLVLNLDSAHKDSYARSLPPLEVLVVAGGGGGGGNSTNNFRTGGGGGGGGVIYNSAYQLNNSAAITVTVGAGGGGAQSIGNSGNNSVFGALTAIGGGGGGGTSTTGNVNGLSGGSGGGGGDYNGNGGGGTAGQGFRGGDSRQSAGAGSGASGGGGGGAGGPGPDAINTFVAQSGGASITYSISGTSTNYAGGGGVRSCSPADNNPGTSGGVNTGTGGEGARFNVGGSGGSGIVIIRYSGPQAATGGTVVSANGYTTHTFTTSGTFTPALWNDLSGNNNNGTLVNGVEFISYQNGGILDFDGSDDYADLGNPTVLRNLTAGSIEAVYYRDASTGTYQMIFTDAASDFEITYSGNVLQFYIGNSGISYTHAVTGQWFYVAGIWAAGSKKLYLNGVEVASGTNTGINTGNRDRYVGGRGTSFPFNGKIPIVRAYNRALSAAEITQNYNATKTRFSL